MSGKESQDEKLNNLAIRRYEPVDQLDVSRLYVEGLLAGQITPNDTGADIENITEAYFSNEASYFWVAEVEGVVQGMIGVARDQDHIAEIRRLRIARDYQHTALAARLVETALTHCQKHGYLKIVLDTRFDPDTVLNLFDRFGFQHTRTKPIAGKELLEFYLDLYRQPKQESEG